MLRHFCGAADNNSSNNNGAERLALALPWKGQWGQGAEGREEKSKIKGGPGREMRL